jgi:hypothetical protein
MGEAQKKKIDKAIDQSLSVMEEILDAPMAAKDNLMKTNFKIANTTLGFVGRILQAESAMVQAVTVMADRAGKSDDFRAMIEENLPHITFPKKQLKK